MLYLLYNEDEITVVFSSEIHMELVFVRQTVMRKCVEQRVCREENKRHLGTSVLGASMPC